MKRFEDVLSWQHAKELTVLIYKQFKSVHDGDFKYQIQRASVSIMNNIAEGFERNTDKELKHFLYIAKGSCGEIRSMLDLALTLKYINKTTYEECHGLAEEISKLLAGFIKKL